MSTLKISFILTKNKLKNMGKGDKKTRRGKIQRGSYGVRRLRIKKRTSTLEKISVDKKSKP